LGSPLGHAEVLLAKNLSDLRAKQSRREVPRCPPELERNVFSFQNGGQGPLLPHHAALFAPTRWTNLYFPSSWAIFGDPIGGPVVPVFGPGVKDVAVETDQQFGIFTHTLYWTRPPSAGVAPHIQALRDALRIA
jgi:hypothetical protein